jgi:hypothetical protein
MQAQVVHQRKATLPWIPMLIAALVVFATVAGVQLALRDRGSAPAVTVVDDGTGPGVRDIGGHGAARISAGEDIAAASQKAAMVDAGVTSISGVRGVTDVLPWSGGPHPRTKFGAGAARVDPPSDVSEGVREIDPRFRGHPLG